MSGKFEETLVEDEDPSSSETTDSECEYSEDDYEAVVLGTEEQLAAPYDEMNRKKKKALLEFRCVVEDAILGNFLLGKPNLYLSKSEASKEKEILREITLWGVPLLPSKSHEGTDIVLLKFLRAKDFNVQNAFQMLRRTLKWRKDFKTDKILEERFSPDFGAKVLDLNSKDKEGHPLCYNAYEHFNDMKVYNTTFGSKEKCNEFLRWRIQYMEKSVARLEFRNGAVHSLLQITDLKNFPGPVMKELRSVSKKALLLFQDNYPGIVHKNIVINVPLWYYTIHMLRTRFICPKAKKKFVLARPTKATKTLLKFIAPENLPVQYGGLKREIDDDFSTLDKASELKMKANSSVCIEFPVSLVGLTLIWDLTVVGWEVSYKEEFIPDDESSYKILIQNKKKLCMTVRNSFYINEPGKILITIDNCSFKKKRVLYRSKAKPTTVPMYVFLKNK